jgi:4-carboxymuconolactone decarboxylase
MSRYQQIPRESMSEAQRRVYDMIAAGRRGEVRGPFAVLLRAPEICEHAARLGEHLRWGSSLPSRLSELAIILTARSLRAQYEWYAHAPLAEKAGVPAAAIEAIRKGETPRFTASDEALVYRIVSELQKTQRLSDASFAAAVGTLGERGLIEIIAIIGYYTLIGNTLNVFQVALPPGATPPFAE